MANVTSLRMTHVGWRCRVVGLFVTLFLRKALKSDRLGIEITTDPVSSGAKVEFLVEHLREFVVRFIILNKATHCTHFTYYTVLHKLRCLTLEDERRVTRACPLLLCPGEAVEMTGNTPKTCR